MYTVYEMKCNMTGEVYVGCTSSPLNIRMSHHKYDQYRRDHKLHKHIRKFGFDMAAKPVKKFSDRREALDFEAKQIKKKGTLNMMHATK